MTVLIWVIAVMAYMAIAGAVASISTTAFKLNCLNCSNGLECKGEHSESGFATGVFWPLAAPFALSRSTFKTKDEKIAREHQREVIQVKHERQLLELTQAPVVHEGRVIESNRGTRDWDEESRFGDYR